MEILVLIQYKDDVNGLSFLLSDFLVFKKYKTYHTLQGGKGGEASFETWFYERFILLFYESFAIPTKILK